MNSRDFQFPPPLGQVISRLPALPPSFVLAKLLNVLLFRRPEYQSLLPLYGKLISIRVRDVGLQFRFILDENGFQPVARDGQPDLSISASAYDFMRLASRQVDPDSLFFNRRLIIEGETELGLIAKNTLDALDFSKISLPALFPRRLMQWLGTQ